MGHGGLGTNSRQLLNLKVVNQQVDETDLIGVFFRVYDIDEIVANKVSHWKDMLRISKREAHENVVYIDGGLAKELPHT